MQASAEHFSVCSDGALVEYMNFVNLYMGPEGHALVDTAAQNLLCGVSTLRSFEQVLNGSGLGLQFLAPQQKSLHGIAGSMPVLFSALLPSAIGHVCGVVRLDVINTGRSL